MKKQKAIESVWLAKTLSVVLAVLILAAMCLIPTSAAELTADGTGASTVAHSVNAEFTAAIPAYVMPGEPGEVSADYTVTLKNAVIPDNHELTAKVEYSGSMSEQNGVKLPYELLDESGVRIASGSKILTKAAGTPDESVSVSFGAALTAKARYAGVYADTATFSFEVEEDVYTKDEINADAHIDAIGKFTRAWDEQDGLFWDDVISIFNEKYTDVEIRKNGANSCGIIADWDAQLCPDSPMKKHAKTLKTAVVQNGIKHIGNQSFDGCSKLTSVSLPDGLESIGNSAFAGCDALTDVSIPNSVTSIGRMAFFWCSSITSIEIPGGVTAILDNTFYACWSLERITIPDSVTRIEESAFESCEMLTEITIPASVISIDSTAFKNSGLKTIYGTAGSYAETFAAENGYTFIAQ